VVQAGVVVSRLLEHGGESGDAAVFRQGVGVTRQPGFTVVVVKDRDVVVLRGSEAADRGEGEEHHCPHGLRPERVNLRERRRRVAGGDHGVPRIP
jgi:hypothetical protein